MRYLLKAVSLIASVLILGLMFLTVSDVIGRNILHHPIRGATELTEIGMVILTFLLFPLLAAEGRHIVADVADVFQSKLLDVVQILLTAGLGCWFFGLIAWRMWSMAERTARFHDVTASLGIAISPVLYVVAVLAGFGAMSFLLPLRKLPAALRTAPKAPVPERSIL